MFPKSQYREKHDAGRYRNRLKENLFRISPDWQNIIKNLTNATITNGHKNIT
jgi:hypothetical protein